MNTKKESRIKIAVQLVIMDAIEKGHTQSNDLIEYMKSETFNKSVAEYEKGLNMI